MAKGRLCVRGASLSEVAGARHGFSTRVGGVSEGDYESLNCGLESGDRPERVVVNRARAARDVDADAGALCTARQHHGTTVVTVHEAWADAARPPADALVTAVPSLALGVLTADCAPVLLAEPDARVIGAVHASWRGALGGVIEAAVVAMARLGARPQRIVAAVGPCIAQASYEVGPEFPAPFLADDPAAAALFVPAAKDGHFRFDLAAYVARRLAAAGIATIENLGLDTCTEEARFFSYRRARQRRQQRFGLGLSAIVLAP